MIGPVWVSIATAIGSFSVSLLSIFLGYKLFMAGATGAFKFKASALSNGVGFESVAPGLAFALFGMMVAIYAIHGLMGTKY